MELQNAENYKYYKCRSLLACDTGGTVYDTTKRCDDEAEKINNPRYDLSTIQYAEESRCKSGLSDNIIYIIDTKKECELKKKSLIDFTTHLDDDEFNDYEMYSNMSQQPETEVVRCFSSEDEVECFDENETSIANREFEFCDVESIPNESVQNIIDHILNNDDSNHSSSTICLENSDHEIKEDSLLLDASQTQEELNFRFFSSSPQCKIDLSNLSGLNGVEINKDKYDPSIKIEFQSNRMSLHKRKQIYNIKDDPYTELIKDEKNIPNKAMFTHSKSKRNRSMYNKENEREKLKYQQRNPFKNLRMSSILKENKKQSIKKIKNRCKKLRKESTSSSNDSFELSSANSNDGEILVNKTGSCHFELNSANSNDGEILLNKTGSYHNNYFSSTSRNSMLQEIQLVTELNSEFTNADYFEYVQPRERIIESDMDKLLTPTIDAEFTEIFKACKIKDLMRDQQGNLDCNGNEVYHQDIEKLNSSKSVLSPNEMAERELFLKSAYARKLGYENYFNTSNDSVINEILFDPTLAYEEIKLDINRIRNIEVSSKQKLFFNQSFKSVSCTLLESLNEFNRFGGFVEEKYEKDKSTEVEEDSDVIFLSDESTKSSDTNNSKQKNSSGYLFEKLKEKERDQKKPNFIFNFSNKSNLVNLDFQSRYKSLEYLNKADTNKWPPPSIKIKIKRINDENEYVIDDSNGHNMNFNDKNTIKSVKHIDRYECDDCSTKFRTKRILKNHVSENHRGPYDTECEICHMKYKKSSAHKKHQPWCLRYVTYKCDFCNKVYCYQASLAKHLKSHKKLIKSPPSTWEN